MAQQRQTYHHKDLRNALIETGIQLVSTEGVNAFSLRKLMLLCPVPGQRKILPITVRLTVL